MRKNIEIAILSLFIISLPLSEAIKNVSWLLYLVAWTSNRVSAHDFGGKWGGWDWIFLLWLPSGFIVAALSNQGLNEWDGATDLLRYIGLAWLVIRARYDRSTLRNLLVLLIFTTFVSASISYFWLGDKMVGHHSVGHINHSAIYSAISAGAAIALTAGYWKTSKILTKAAMLTLSGLLLWATALASARGALLPLILVFIPLLGIGLYKKAPFVLASLLLGVGALTATAVHFDLPVVQKTMRIAQGGIGVRDKTWNSGFLVWKAHPISGVGMENTKYFLTEEKLKEIAESLKLEFNPDEFYFGSHAHNLYANGLAERGLLGMIPLFLALSAWGITLLRRTPTKETSSLEAAAWGGALAAWVLATVGGLFNTTLHHEHASLSLLLLAIWISSYQPTNSSPKLLKS